MEYSQYIQSNYAISGTIIGYSFNRIIRCYLECPGLLVLDRGVAELCRVVRGVVDPDWLDS